MTTAGIDVSGREVFQTLMIAPMVVVADERIDLCLKVAGQEVVFQQDAVLECLMPTFDLALRLRMIRRAARVRHAFAVQIVR